MKHAIAILKDALHTAETNEPINQKEGQVAQADLERVTAAECRQAISILEIVSNGPIFVTPQG